MDTQAVLSYQANILMEPHASKRVNKALSIGNLFNKLTNLIPISYWHEFLDIVFFFKANNGLIYIDNDVIPAISEATRASRSSRNTNAGSKTCKDARRLHTRALFRQILPYLEHTARAVTRQKRCLKYI